MTRQTLHSALPFYMSYEGDKVGDNGPYAILDANGNLVAQVIAANSTEDCAEKAKAILNACNNNERLQAMNVELQKALQSMMNDSGLVTLMRPDQIERNRAALKYAAE